jgi:hypothetical protein
MAQFQITIDIPNGMIPAAKKAIRYSDTITDPNNPRQTISNPVTALEHFQNYVLNKLRQDIRNTLEREERVNIQAQTDTITPV